MQLTAIRPMGSKTRSIATEAGEQLYVNPSNVVLVQPDDNSVLLTTGHWIFVDDTSCQNAIQALRDRFCDDNHRLNPKGRKDIPMNDQTVRGYKAFCSDMTCRGMQYEVGMTFEHDGELVVCESGLHFCENCADVFGYYKYDPNCTRVCEVVALGNVVTDDHKSCTDKLEIVRELTWNEIMEKVNVGQSNTGIHNTGSLNSGNWNSGYHNSGICNNGDYNSGGYNSSNWNTGDCNSSDWNTGDCNSGYCNSGYCNDGNRNSGDYNSGDNNSGNRNSGDWNSGDWNITNFSSGVLCTEEPKCLIFDEPTDMTLDEWRQSRAAAIMSRVELPRPIWREWDELSDEQRRANASFERLGGMLVVPENCGKPDFEGWWSGLTDGEKRVIFAIPNFDAAKWERITGLDVTTDPAWTA